VVTHYGSLTRTRDILFGRSDPSVASWRIQARAPLALILDQENCNRKRSVKEDYKMDDSEFWLNLTIVALGVGALAFLLIVLYCTVQQLTQGRRGARPL
jgi:hypothetical protein